MVMVRGGGISRSESDDTVAVGPGEDDVLIKIIGKKSFGVGGVVFNGFDLLILDIDDVVGIG